jgi:hypothetical protein
MTQCGATSRKPQPTQAYQARTPEATALYQTIQTHCETWLELASSGQFDGQGDDHTLPRFVEQAFRKYSECGVFLQRPRGVPVVATALNCALRLFLRAIRSALIERCKTTKGATTEEINKHQIGAVAFIHRFSSDITC